MTRPGDNLRVDIFDCDDPEVPSLAEAAARVVRTRVLNATWMGATCRHGREGAFEMQATVDHPFGWDEVG